MTNTDIERRLRTSLTELTSTTPFANPNCPRTQSTAAHASDTRPAGRDGELRTGGEGSSPTRRSIRPVRIVVGAVSAVLFIAGFALAVVYGPGSSDNGGSRSAIAPAQSARHLAAIVELRSEDLPGWSGYNTPTPNPAAAKKLAQCMGIGNPHLASPVAVVRSKQFDSKNVTVYAQSTTYVMATVAQAKQLTAFYRQARLPSCYADQTGGTIAANLESTSHLSGVKVLGVSPAPPGVNTSDSQTISTSYLTQQVGATGMAQTVVQLMFVRIGRLVTYLAVSALLTAGPFPMALFNRLAVTLSKRLADVTRPAIFSR